MSASSPLADAVTDVLQLTSTQQAYVLLSGGMDSAACLSFYLEYGFTVSALFVKYGQAAEEREEEAAHAVADYYRVKLRTGVWTGERPIPARGEIPGRNALLVSAGLLEFGDRTGTLALGIHADTPYSDCGSSFVRASQHLIDCYAYGRLSLGTPFLAWSKRDIAEFSRSHGVPLRLTWSCEASGTRPCGECLSCKDREAMNA